LKPAPGKHSSTRLYLKKNFHKKGLVPGEGPEFKQKVPQKQKQKVNTEGVTEERGDVSEAIFCWHTLRMSFLLRLRHCW
jgi:hypothetical protein